VLKTLFRRSTHTVPIRPQKNNGSSCSSQEWHPRRHVCDCLFNSYRPGLFQFFGRGPHKLLHNNSRAGHLAQCDFFGICYIPNQHIFRKCIIFSLLAKCILRPGETASQVRFCPAGRSAENPDIDYVEEWWQHTPLSESNTNAERLWFHSVDVDTMFWARIQLLDGQQEVPVNTVFPQRPPKLFTRNATICFPEVDKARAYVFGMLPRFRDNLLESGGLVYSATAATKPHWILSSFGLIIFATSWHTLFLGDCAKRCRGSYSFTHVSLFVYRDGQFANFSVPW